MVQQSERPPRTATELPMRELERYGREHFGHIEPLALAPAPPAPGLAQRAHEAMQAGVRLVRSTVSNVVALARRAAPRLAMDFGRRHDPPAPVPAPAPSPALAPPPAPAPAPPPAPHTTVPDVDTMSGWVGRALSRMKASTASGLDDLPAAFLKHARVREGREWRHVLCPLLS